MMQKISINGLTLFYDAAEQDAAELIRGACEKSARLLHEHWGLGTPTDCRVYVMTSWQGFMFQSAPWPWKILLVVTLPLWASRVRRTWALAGGWAQKFGRRQVVGVKPPRLLELADKRIGERIFIKEPDLDRKVQNITCHELTHAFTAHLRLPTWLREGLAMVTVDKFFEQPTVQRETLAMLAASPGTPSPGGTQKLRVEDEDALVGLYARGYWLTRYIEETQPGLIKDLLSQSSQPAALESRIAAAYEKQPDTFWEEINGVLAAYFEQSQVG